MRRIRRWAACGLLLAGCGIVDPDPLVSRPARLQPETDAFARDSVRTYDWIEGRTAGGKDSVLLRTSLKATRRDTVVADSARILLRLQFAAGAVPAAAVTQLGFHPARVEVDPNAVPDPGPLLEFPEHPQTGWRSDSLHGHLRFVRRLQRLETVKLAGARHECWAFAESTFWDGQLLSTGSYCMGRYGLVRHRREWKHDDPSGAVGGTVWREVRTQ